MARRLRFQEESSDEEKERESDSDEAVSEDWDEGRTLIERSRDLIEELVLSFSLSLLEDNVRSGLQGLIKICSI